jgi:hypothetical protein
VVEHTMDVSSWLRKQLEEASPDLLRLMVKDFAEALMSADADAVCGAGYGERSPERVIAATATASVTGTRASAPSSSRCRSSGRAATSPSGYCNRAAERSRRSCR